MNIIQSAIQHIRLTIPEEILREAFLGNRYQQRNLSYSLDHMIRTEVYDRKVAVDMNAVGGTEALIPLRGIGYTIVDNVNIIMTIPRDLTQGRSITSALSISIADNYAPAIAIGAAQAMPVSPYLQQTAQVVDSALQIPLVSSARIRLIDENTIMINEAPTTVSLCYLRCILENDTDLTNIQPSSYPMFRDMFTMAVKSYVYNQLIIKMGKGLLIGGMDIGIFKDVVDSYADSETLYQEFIPRWTKLSILNDSLSKYRHLTMVGSLI